MKGSGGLKSGGNVIQVGSTGSVLIWLVVLGPVNGN